MIDHKSESSEDEEDILDLKNDEGWEDVEPDVEHLDFVSLFSDASFDSLPDMLAHMKKKYDFDLAKVKQHLNLDLLDMIKLVNYIRSMTRDERLYKIHCLEKSDFEDDRYLQPVLEDDPVLYSLEDIVVDGQLDQCGASAGPDMPESSRSSGPIINGDDDQLTYKEKLWGMNQSLEKSMQQLDLTRKALDKANENADLWKSKHEALSKDHHTAPAHTGSEKSQFDDPYAGKSIHQQMLQDRIRTDAYRDFIRDNEGLFTGRTVLDVGCGTGILSMFCAQAGAARVFAVESSMIYQKAQQIVYDNGFQDVIKVLHGKVEEVHLPVEKVDIIISEWMGYALLYEGMLDSVLWARDHFLAEGGLMIPAHADLWIAPLSDQEYALEKRGFWKSVYGFNMSAMRKDQDPAVDVDDRFNKDRIQGTACVFKDLDLQTIKLEDLSFTNGDFRSTVDPSCSEIDGFIIWFDVHFSSRLEAATSHKVRQKMFSTSPCCKRTHWGQAVCITENPICRAANDRQVDIRAGEVTGKVGYSKGKEAGSLNINVAWEWQGRKGEQMWKLT